MININCTTMGYRVSAWPNIQLKEAQFSLYEHLNTFNDYYWDKQIKRYRVKDAYRFYDNFNQELYLPIYDLPRFIALAEKNGYPHKVKHILPVEGEPVEIKLKPGVEPRDDRQVKCIDFLINDPRRIRAIELDGGGGKTFITIAALAQLGRRAMIRVSGLVDQWVARIKQFTTLEDKDIFVISGGDSLGVLINGIANGKLHPKIIVASIGTLRNYALQKEAYLHLPPFNQFDKLCGIGITVIDEAHLNFRINYTIDLLLNPKLVIPLTATFDVTKTRVKEIFDRHYPLENRFGGDMAKRYVCVNAIKFSSGPNPIPQWAVKGSDGYSHVMYENYLMSRANVLNYIYHKKYKRAIDEFYIEKHNPGERCLVMAATSNMCHYLLARIEEDYPNKKSAIYMSGTTPDELLEENDIIISTQKSSGTGRDISKLRTLINTISIRSEPTNKQILLRLRELPDGSTPQYVYLYNSSVPQHMDHHAVREMILGAKAKQFVNLLY